jgi:hypothetical protein
LTVSHLPSLAQSLQGRDLGHLKIIAEAWGLDGFNPVDARAGIQRLVSTLPDARILAQVTLELPETAQDAFFDLAQSEGKMAWALFTRRYGALRNIGAARRDRERPHLHPTSPTEALWYRGLIGRSFFDTPDGPQEYAFIPQDLFALAPKAPVRTHRLGRIASPVDRENLFVANDKIVDHACTFLAARRAGQTDRLAYGNWSSEEYDLAIFLLFIEKTLISAGLLDSKGLPVPEPVRTFLGLDRRATLNMLLQAWLASVEINDLRLLPGLIFEGEWQNEPRRTRQVVLDLLSAAPGQRLELPWSSGAPRFEAPGSERSFVSLPSFTEAVYREHPDFQRPAGDYDSWFIRDAENGEFLRGFDYWARVDGAFLKFMICGPLYWLGLIDLAGPTPAADAFLNHIRAFRLSLDAQDLLDQKTSTQIEEEDEPWIIRSDGRVLVPRLSARSARYQITRFGDSEGLDNEVYHYRLTSASLDRARQQGLQVSHLLRLLHRQAKAVPPSLVEALERWEAHGLLVHIEKVMVLRVKNPEILQVLRSSRAARFLGDPLGPTSVIIKPGAIDAVLSALLDIGYLSDVTIDKD